MNVNELKSRWLEEERVASGGWDFSHLDGRYFEEKLPWDYKKRLKEFLKPATRLLDMGGGEFFLSLKHPFALSSVTEERQANYELCMKKLAPLGVNVKKTGDSESLPFENEAFDLVINRHERYDLNEVRRVLKKGGHFITQQVGGENGKQLAAKLLPNYVARPSAFNLENEVPCFKAAGFKVVYANQAYPIEYFTDIGAVCFYARAIERAFPGFSVERCFENLLKLQDELEKRGRINMREHRFIVVAKKG